MKRKISILFALIITVTVMTFNFQIAYEENITGSENINLISQNASANVQLVQDYKMVETEHCYVCWPDNPLDFCDISEQCCWDQDPYCEY